MKRAPSKMMPPPHVNTHLNTVLEASWGGEYDHKITKLCFHVFACCADLIPPRRVRLRSDGAAVPRRQSGGETHSPTRATDTPPRAAACPSSPHKLSLSKTRMESPEKRRLGTFGSAGSIYPDRKAYPEGHPLRPVTGATRHSSLGDQKSLEAEALAEVYMRILPLRVCGLVPSAPETKHQPGAKKADRTEVFE